jgi:Tol biopolymer transport system component
MPRSGDSQTENLPASLRPLRTSPCMRCRGAWCFDDERLAFTSDDAEGRGEIYVMNADGSGLTKLTDDPAAEDFYPAWRP